MTGWACPYVAHAVVRQAFEEQEQLIFEQLSGLCRDACWTKTYMAGEMMILKDLFQVREGEEERRERERLG